MPRYIPTWGSEWWALWHERRKELRQSPAYGPRRISVYSTHSYRSNRLRPNRETSDRYITNWKYYYETRGHDDTEFDPIEFNNDATSDTDLFGRDPIMEMIKVSYPLHGGRTVGPSNVRVNKYAITARQAGRGTPQLMAAGAAASSGEDAFIPKDYAMQVHAFERNSQETRNYGQVISNNKFEQQIQIYNPAVEDTILPVSDEVRATPFPSLITANNNNTTPTGYQALSQNPTWSKMMTAIIMNYTFEFHDFVYATPWAESLPVFNYVQDQANITREPVARLNAEYNFYDPEHEAAAAGKTERQLEPIIEAPARDTNNWIGSKTEELVSQQSQEKKGQFPYYIELETPTQKEGPLLKAIRKFGFEETLFKDLVEQFDNIQIRNTAFELTPVLKKTSWIHAGTMIDKNRPIKFGPVGGAPQYTSNLRHTMRSLNIGNDNTKQELESVEFYGSKHSLFQIFYDQVTAGERSVCGTYRDRMMLMGLRSKMEQILGKRENRITYMQTLPPKDVEQRSPWPDNLDAAPCKTETLFYKITKSHNGRAIGVYYVSNPKEGILKFIDTQVKANKPYTYEVDAFVASYGIAYRYALPPLSHRQWWWRTESRMEQIEGRRVRMEGVWMPKWSTRRVRGGGNQGTRREGPLVETFVHYIPSVKVFKVPVFHRRQLSFYLPSPSPNGLCFPEAKIIDRPPAPPGVSFVPYRGKNNKVLVNLSDNIESIGVGSTGARFFAFTEAELTQFNEIHTLQKAFENNKLQRGHIEFRSEGDVETVEVYRTTNKPTRGPDETWADEEKKPYDVFGIGAEDSEPHKIISLNQQTAFKDDLKPNVVYYYTLRSKDRNGYISNPSPIYAVELVDDNGKVYALVNVFEPVKPKQLTVQKQKLVRYLEISPAPISSEIFDRGENVAGDRIGLVSGDDSAFGKTFKVRVRSKDTGRAVDLNIRFRSSVELDESIQQVEEAEEAEPLCADDDEE